MHYPSILMLLISGFIICGCQNPPAGEDTQSGKAETAEPAPAPPELTLLWETDTVLKVNESAYFDEKRQRLIVSCIAGNPLDKNGTGYLSLVSPVDGKILNQHWVTGLDAPKGIGLQDNLLYVTNIDELVEIDRMEGKILSRYKVEGAEFLNDVVCDQNRVYFSDMNTGKLHRWQAGEVSTLRADLHGINGITFGAGHLYVLTGAGLLKITPEGEIADTINRQVTGGDGLVMLGPGRFLASRWKGELWLIEGAEATKLLDSKDDEVQTADIGYQPDKSVLFVPRFFAHKVSAYQFAGGE